LQDIKSELENIDIQITRVQEYILLLQDKRASYIEDMTKLQPTIAPHKSLPSEMLIEIFLHYAAEIAEQVIIYRTRPAYHGLWPFPWVVGQICSRWRQIALAEPRIWGTIGFNAVDYGKMPMLNAAFRPRGRSRLRLSTGKGEDEKCIYDDFLRHVVCSQSKRITELSLFVFVTTVEKLFALPLDSFPVLEDVQLSAMTPR